jgi:hypothetical protein
MTLQDNELLAAVERSPSAAGAHDRAGWVGLFTADGRIEDPVGSRPHVGHPQIGRFYDTFIGPRDVAFRRDLDVVHGNVVVRDLELGVTMGSVSMTIPAFLRYDLHRLDGQWKIAELRAFWDLPAMMWQFLRNGAPAVPAALHLSYGLLRHQRLAGTVGFAAGFRRAGLRSRRLLAGFLTAVAHADGTGAARALSPGATITIGDDEPIDLAEFSERLRGAGCTKVVAAGSTIAASLSAVRERGVVFADVTRLATMQSAQRDEEEAAHQTRLPTMQSAQRDEEEAAHQIRLSRRINRIRYFPA